MQIKVIKLLTLSNLYTFLRCIFRLPISPETARLLFAAIAIDTTLPKKRKRGVPVGTADVIEVDGENIELTASNPSRDKQTVDRQTYQNYKSALKFWHEYSCQDMDKEGKPWPEPVNKVINDAVASYKREVGDKKRRGVMAQKEGKSAYNLTGYVAICSYFMKMHPDGNRFTWMESIFAGLFTKLSVHTIGRSDNIDDLLLYNMSWENDAMTISFSTSKPDQSGCSTNEKKRLYANPFRPEICVVLGMAIYTWCKTRNQGDRFLFDGVDQHKRYYNCLMRALKEIPESIHLGTTRSDIGTHSNRKFAESTSASKIDGPTHTQTCLRAGQSVGRSQDCYMKQEDDGDAIVGRTLAQLELNAKILFTSSSQLSSTIILMET